jgi:hypothetical protein
MVIEGKLHAKFDAQQISDTFKKRDFVVEYAENVLYPQYVTFQAIQDRCALLDSYHEGDRIAVDFNLRGREWTSPQGEKKYFNTLEAWRINPAQEGVAGDPPQSGQAIASDQWSDQASDLPF